MAQSKSQLGIQAADNGWARRVLVPLAFFVSGVFALSGPFLSACSGAASKDDAAHGGANGKADAPGSIAVSVDRTWVRPAEQVTLTVDALDLSGRPTTSWSLRVRPDEGTRVVPAGGNRVMVVMSRQGVYRLTVTNDLSQDDDQVKVRVDEAGCKVVVDSPPRGAALIGTDGTTVTVTGHVEDSVDQLHTMKINGDWARVDSAGRFRTQVRAHRGINILTVETFDSMGNPFRTVESFLLAREYVDASQGIRAGLRLGPASVELIETLLVELLNGNQARGEQPLQLVAFIPHPIPTDSGRLEDVTSVELGTVTGQLSPQPDGKIGLNAQVTTRTVVKGWAEFLGGRHDFVITVDSVTMAAMYHVSLDQGHAVVTASDLSVELGPTDIDLDWAPDWLAGDIEGTVRKAVETALRRNVPNLVSSFLDGVGGARQVPQYQEYLGTVAPLTWTYDVAGIQTDWLGVTLQLDLGADGGTGWHVPELPGAPILSSAQDVQPDVHADLGLATDMDAVNRLLYAMWRGGAVSQSFDAAPYLPALEDLPFSPTSVEVALNGLLPPVATIQDGALYVTIGDLQVDLFISSKLGAMNATAYAFGTFRVDVVPDDHGYRLSVQVVDVDVDVDRVSMAGLDTEAIEAYVRPIAKKYLPRMLAHSAMIPVGSVSLEGTGLAGSVQIQGLQFVTTAEGALSVSGRPVRVFE